MIQVLEDENDNSVTEPMLKKVTDDNLNSSLNDFVIDEPAKVKSEVKVSNSIFRTKDRQKCSKTKKSKMEAAAEAKVDEDEDTVDVDFTASMKAPMTSASASAASAPSSPNAKTEAEPPTVKVSLFKHHGGQSRGRKRKKGRGERGCEDLHYDSDSIDIDVLATFSAKTFNNSASVASTASGLSPTLNESSTDSSAAAFSVLLKKPLTKKDGLMASSPASTASEAVEAAAEDEGQCDSDKKVAVVNTREIKTPAQASTKTEAATATASEATAKAASASKVNAFSRLMAPKGKNKNVEEADAVSAMPKNDNDTSIGINGDEASNGLNKKRTKRKSRTKCKSPSVDAFEVTELNSSLTDFVQVNG